MIARRHGVPITVFTDAENGRRRCINALHVQTFVANPFGEGTLVTFASGDRLTVTEDFEAVVDSFMADRPDG